MSSIRHNTLNKWTDSLVWIFDPWAQGLYHFDKNALIRSVHVRVIEARSIIECHVPNCAHLDAWSDRFIWLHAFKFTRLHLIVVMYICNDLSDIVQKCGFSLSTFSKYTGCPLFDVKIFSISRIFFYLSFGICVLSHLRFFLIHIDAPPN